ncbi:MAG: hypothetical protein ABW217_18650 [Polyangiaceae bacterium]
MLAASWVGACDADDEGLFSDDAPLSPTGGSGASGSGASGSGASGSGASASGASGSGASGGGASGGGTSGSGTTGGTGGSSTAAGSGGGSDVPGNNGGAGGEPEPPDGEDPADGLTPALPSDAPDVAFQDGNCSEFVPCGGALAGTWVFSDACIDDGDLGLDLSDDGCEDVAASVDATVSGALNFSGNSVQHLGAGTGSGQLRIPNLCTLAIASCPGLRALIDNDVDACDQSGVDCLCDFETAEAQWDRETFQAQGSTITFGGGRTFDYCVDGDTLTYRETSEGVSPQDAALHVLTRQ